MKPFISLFLLCSLLGLGQGISKNTLILSGSCGLSNTQIRDTLGNTVVPIQKFKTARFELGLTYMVKERFGLTIGYATSSNIQDDHNKLTSLYVEDKQRTLSMGTLHLFKIIPKIYLGLNPRLRHTWLKESSKSSDPRDLGYTTRTFAIDLNLRAYWFFHRRWALSVEQSMGSVSYLYKIVNSPPNLASNRSFDSSLLPSFQLGQLSFGLNYLINNKAGKAEQAPVQP